jgi:DNA invertase Pin-like site-specific DNA recombinase
MQKKAAIYCRTASTPSDGNDLAAKKQEEICRDNILRHGYKEVGVFSDLGVSGMTLPRPALTDMLGFLIKENDPSIIVTAARDRLGRDEQSLTALLKELANTNVELVTVDSETKENDTAE